jgi:hypothetical protein
LSLRGVLLRPIRLLRGILMRWLAVLRLGRLLRRIIRLLLVLRRLICLRLRAVISWLLGVLPLRRVGLRGSLPGELVVVALRAALEDAGCDVHQAGDYQKVRARA